MEGYEKLASAIVASGIKEYFEAGKKASQFIYLFLTSNSQKKKTQYLENFEKQYTLILENKEFFFSSRFSIFTDMDAGYIYKKLKERIGEYANERFFKQS